MRTYEELTVVFSQARAIDELHDYVLEGVTITPDVLTSVNGRRKYTHHNSNSLVRAMECCSVEGACSLLNDAITVASNAVGITEYRQNDYMCLFLKGPANIARTIEWARLIVRGSIPECISVEYGNGYNRLPNTSYPHFSAIRAMNNVNSLRLKYKENEHLFINNPLRKQQYSDWLESIELSHGIVQYVNCYSLNEMDDPKLDILFKTANKTLSILYSVDKNERSSIIDKIADKTWCFVSEADAIENIKKIRTVDTTPLEGRGLEKICKLISWAGRVYTYGPPSMLIFD